MRYLIADRQSSARSALRLLLDQYPDMTYAGETDNFPKLTLLNQSEAPDLILVEWEVLGPWPRGGLQQLKKDRNPAVIVLSCCLDRQTVLDAGGDYYVSKAEKPSHLVSVIEDVRTRLAKPKPMSKVIT